jgi:hypothetical protein
MQLLAEDELPQTLQVHNAIIAGNYMVSKSFLDIKKSLESASNTPESKQTLAYLYEYE